MRRGPNRKPITSAMIASTIRISSKVMPAWPASETRPAAALSLGIFDVSMVSSLRGSFHQLAHVHERFQDRKHDESDCDAHEQDHERLEQAGQALQAHLDLLLV